MKLFILAVLTLATGSIAAAAAKKETLITPPEAVIQGERVQPHEAIAGSVVKLQMIGGSCTGTAISSNVVVTAAHCRDVAGTILRVGHIAGMQLPCSVTEVEEVAYAPGATLHDIGEHKTHIPDIALLKLKAPICGLTPANLRIAPVQAGEVLQAAGYGRGTYTQDRPDRLALKAIEASDIASAYADAVAANPAMQDTVDYFTQVTSLYYKFALPLNDKSSLCNGDSGGPVYQEVNGETQLVGVNGAIAGHPIKGTAECQYGYLQLYTPIAPYAEWIEAKVAEWGK